MKKKIFRIILAIVLCLCAYKVVDATSYHFVKAKADIYLCQKYDAKLSEFELVNYEKAHVYWVDYLLFLIEPKWADFTFEYKYNGRNFFVNRFDGKFYDDYQIVDIEKWCTDLLKENVDENIIGIKTSSIHIVNYLKDTHKGNKHLIEPDEAIEYMNYICSYDEFCVKYYTEHFLHEGRRELMDEISRSVAEYLNTNQEVYVNLSRHNEVYIEKYDKDTIRDTYKGKFVTFYW